jgi:hypothetical protein
LLFSTELLKIDEDLTHGVLVLHALLEFGVCRRVIDDFGELGQEPAVAAT